MHKTEKDSSGLVDPSDYSEKEEEISAVKQSLADVGFSTTDQEWLVELFKRPDCFGDPTGKSVFRHDEFGAFGDDLLSGLNTLKKWVQIEEDKGDQTFLAFLFSSMLGFGPGGISTLSPNKAHEKSNGSSDIPQWVSEFQKHAAFCAERLDWNKLRKGSPNAVFDFSGLLFFLFPNGVPLNQIVNLNLLDPTQRRQRRNTYLDEFETLEQLEFWLTWRFQANVERCDKVRLNTLLQGFSDLPDDVLGDKILGLLNAIDYGMWNASTSLAWEERLDPLNNGWQVVAHELIPILEILNTREPILEILNTEELNLKPERSPLLKVWWHLSKLIYSWSMGRLESELSDELRSGLVKSASGHIGILRSVLRDTPEKFEEVRDFYDKAFYVLLSFAPPWKCLKPLLLAFTEMTKQAVASDLRTWSEHDSTENPPHPYARVPNWIEVAMYPQNLKSELEKDPYLQDLREEFAKFCLGRLRTKVKNKGADYTDEDFVEPRPAWRWCYVQALAALRVNPGGRGQKTLFWLLNNDPDETVKELAKKAHKKVRHLDRGKPNLDEGASPRRPLFEAFWWLRQAHLITLGIDVDPAGAMRTRRRELHRTREKDDRFK